MVARFVHTLCDSHQWVVANGDIFDLERGPLPFAEEREWGVLSAVHAEVVDALRRPNVVWLAGNHDAQLHHLRVAALSVDFGTRAGFVRVEHGHRFNAPLKQQQRFTSAVTWASGRVADAGLGPVVRAMRVLDHTLTGEGRSEGPIERGARRWLGNQPQHCGMVIGHTHRAGFWNTAGRTLANPGDCVARGLRYASIDATTGATTLHDYAG